MKKLTVFLMGILLVFMLAACGTKNTDNSGKTSVQEQTSDISDTTLPDEKTDEPADSSNQVPAADGKTLVVYYSATGSTEKVANYIAAATGADTFELMPVNSYTSADLNYNNSSSRVSQEHNDIALQDIELVKVTPNNWEEYDVVFVGYPKMEYLNKSAYSV